MSSVVRPCINEVIEISNETLSRTDLLLIKKKIDVMRLKYVEVSHHVLVKVILFMSVVCY